MMRKFAVWLVGVALLGAASPLFALTSGSANVLVVYNKNNAQSVALAQFYQTARGIPDANMLALDPPAAWTPDGNTTALIGDYTTYIYTPVTAAVATIKAAGGRIDYVVLCRNLPFNVVSESITMSVDGALMSPGGTPVGQNSDSVSNDFYNFNGTFADYNAAGGGTIPFLVSRLDGTGWNAARKLVTGAMAQRSRDIAVFLNDATSFTTSLQGNIVTALDVNGTSTLLKAAGIPTQLVTSPFSTTRTFLTGYFSYGRSDATYGDALLTLIRFRPGAIASFASAGSAIELRAAGAREGQVTTLLDNGAVGTVGYTGSTTGTYWYQLDGFPQPDIYLASYLIDGLDLADSFFASLNYVGYTQLLIGDPLCTFAGPGFAGVDPSGGIVSGAAVGGFDGWHTGTGTTDDGKGMRSGATVGGTTGWINTGGGGTGTKATW